MAKIKPFMETPRNGGGNISGLIYRFTHEDGKPLFNYWRRSTYDITDNDII